MEDDEKKPKKSRKASRRRVMDEKIWKEFPDDLLEGVIARLPIAGIIRFSLVCREWISLIESQSFIQRWEKFAPQNKPWLYSKTYTRGSIGNGAMYDPYTKKWKCYSSRTRSIYPVASVGGLVCCVNNSEKCFTVGNPITQTWKKFPWALGVGSDVRSTSIGMVVNPTSSGGYKIVTVDKWGESVIYDSSANSNSIDRDRLHVRIRRKLCSLSNEYKCTPPVTVDTVVYFLISSPDGILSYDVVSGVWERFHIPVPPNSSNLALAEGGGRILLMGLVRSKYVAHFSVCVWEVQKTMSAWKEVDRMQNSWYSDFNAKSASLICLGNKGMLMMVLWTPRIDRFFTYDVVNREWSKAPRFVFPSNTRDNLYMWFGTVFFPSLSGSP